MTVCGEFDKETEQISLLNPILFPMEGQDGSIRSIPHAAKKIFCQPRVYPEHFPSVEFVPKLLNNAKCHLFGTQGVQPSSLLHYVFNYEVWIS